MANERQTRPEGQNRLAAFAGVSRTMLTHVERGMRIPTVEMLFRIAGGLETTPAKILCKVERLSLSRRKG